MFAILITPENLDKILERVTPTEDKHPDFDIFISSEKNWYLVTGFVTERGQIIDWSILPEYVLQKFEYNADTIKTDWDQIVRK